MKKKLIITSLMMASVLPFMGKIETARADEGKNLNEKAKSELDNAKENLKAAEVEKANAQKKLEQAKEDAKDKQAQKENLKNQLTAKQKEREANQKILDKDKRIKEIDAELDELEPEIKQAENEVKTANEKFEKAKKDLKDAENQAADADDFVKAGDPDGLKQKFEADDENLNTSITNKKIFEKQLQDKVGEQNKFKDKKAGIEDFFGSIERDSINPERRKNKEYLEFKNNQEETYRKLDEEANKFQDDIDNIERTLKTIGDNIKDGQRTRDESDRSYRKYKQALNFQKDYKEDKENRIRNLDDFAEQSKQKRDEAEKQLNEAKTKTEVAIGEYNNANDEKNKNIREIAKYNAAAQFLQDKLDENKDNFIINNKKFIEDEITAYKSLAVASEEKLERIKADLKKWSEKIKDLRADQDTAQEHYDQSKWSYEIANEMKDFLEKKKNSNNYEKVEELKNKKKQAEDELAEKSRRFHELTDKGDKLSFEKGELGVIEPDDITKAKEKIDEIDKEIAGLKDHIKELEKSKELKKVKSLEEQIKTLDQQIKDLQKQIKNLENPRKQDNPTRPDHRTEGSSDNNIADDYGIDLSSLSLEKLDKKIRLKNSYLRLKASVNRAKEVVTLAENYAKTGKMDANKRAKLIKLIEKLKVNIGLVEKHLVKMEASL